MNFNALLLTKSEQKNGQTHIDVVSLHQDKLPEGNVLVKIDYSTLNYKDALAITNRAPIAKTFPLVLGIDGAGTVVESQDKRYKKGDNVIINGWGVGERHWGCMAQYARLNADWLIPMPFSLTSWQAMAIGTAGYTAALSVLRLQALGVDPMQGKVLVTGATGGVGSIAVMLLARQGFEVVGSTGKIDQQAYLEKLGAVEILDRSRLKNAGKALQKECWSAAIDTVGSHTLANVCAQMQYQGIVAACGLAQGMDFSATVAPFILRGVTLVGIDSVMAPFEVRKVAWDFLANEIDRNVLAEIAQTVRLEEIISVADAMIAGKTVGRRVVDVNA